MSGVQVCGMWYSFIDNSVLTIPFPYSAAFSSRSTFNPLHFSFTAMICNEHYIKTAGKRIVADQSNTCMYYEVSSVDNKCQYNMYSCPKGYKVSENLYFAPYTKNPCAYKTDPELETPCERRMPVVALVNHAVPWECYGNTKCCHSKIGQAAEFCEARD